MHVESLGKPRDSTSILEALSGKLAIKRQSPCVLYFQSKKQKVIQLTESSELGWKLVDEYEAHPNFSDNIDEKRYYKAETRATRKMETETLIWGLALGFLCRRRRSTYLNSE